MEAALETPPDTLLTFEEVAALLRLGRTAARDALRSADAPAPVRLNARCLRYFRHEVLDWLRAAQARPLKVVASVPTDPAVARPSTGGRTRKNVI